MATLSSMLWLSTSEMDTLGNTREILSRLTAMPRKLAEIADDPEPIEQFQIDVFNNVVGLPVEFGLELWGDRPLDQELAGGSRLKAKKFPDPNHPKAAPGQGEFMEGMLAACEDNYCVLGEAPTGSGKTVTVLNTIGKLGRSALVVVPASRLMYQWRDEVVTHLGLDPEQVGLIGDGNCQWEGCPICIAVIHNLFEFHGVGTFPPEFFKAWGTIAWDECHRLGAAHFASTLQLFPATYRMAVSATPDRKDGCEQIFLDYFGPVRVKSEQKPAPCTGCIIEFPVGPIPPALEHCVSNVKPLQFLAENDKRNDMIVDLICQLYDDGKEILVLTKYVSHAEELLRLCEAQGIPRQDLGQYTGSRTALSQHHSKLKLLGFALRSGVTFPAVLLWFMLVGQRKMKQQELDDAGKASVVIGTYSMLKEGVDIPRLNAGIEALPISDARQAVGRVRRRLPGKGRAFWFVIHDKFQPLRGLDFLWGTQKSSTRHLRECGVKVKYINPPPKAA